MALLNRGQGGEEESVKGMRREASEAGGSPRKCDARSQEKKVTGSRVQHREESLEL